MQILLVSPALAGGSECFRGPLDDFHKNLTNAWWPWPWKSMQISNAISRRLPCTRWIQWVQGKRAETSFVIWILFNMIQQILQLPSMILEKRLQLPLMIFENILQLTSTFFSSFCDYELPFPPIMYVAVWVREPVHNLRALLIRSHTDDSTKERKCENWKCSGCE